MINYLNWEHLHSILKKAPNEINLIDTRSPSEFLLGHCPNATNLPLLDDEERHRVGLTYKTQNKISATQLGLEIFANKAEKYVASLQDLAVPNKNSLSGKKSIAVYCWRGGMRSRAVALLAESIGIDVFVLCGGYKTYRNHVLKILDELALHPLIVLNGLTGVGKSTLIKELAPYTATLDFEQLANHRGSAFGRISREVPLPSQQQFENLLADAYLAIRNAPRIIVEIEAALGNIVMPAKIRRHLLQSPMIFIERDFSDRIIAIESEYLKGWDETSDLQFFEDLKLLSKYISNADRETILYHTKQRHFKVAIEMLLRLRYDPVYSKGLAKFQRQKIFSINTSIANDTTTIMNIMVKQGILSDFTKTNQKIYKPQVSSSTLVIQ